MQEIIERILIRVNSWHSARSYGALVSRKLRENRGDPDLAMAQAVGSLTVEDFARQGDGHVEVLRACGLVDGMSIYDLGCGSGRTAQALLRAGWQGTYKGADVEPRLVAHLKATCPGFEAVVHRSLSIAAADASLDLVFLWSVFTHLYPEECYLYLRDIARALKPGARVVLSFLEFEDPSHRAVFHRRVESFSARGWDSLLDAFIHRDWLRLWAEELGFTAPDFTDGFDGSKHPQFWQTIAVLTKRSEVGKDRSVP